MLVNNVLHTVRSIKCLGCRLGMSFWRVFWGKLGSCAHGPRSGQWVSECKCTVDGPYLLVHVLLVNNVLHTVRSIECLGCRLRMSFWRVFWGKLGSCAHGPRAGLTRYKTPPSCVCSASVFVSPSLTFPSCSCCLLLPGFVFAACWLFIPCYPFSVLIHSIFSTHLSLAFLFFFSSHFSTLFHSSTLHFLPHAFLVLTPYFATSQLYSLVYLNQNV